MNRKPKMKGLDPLPISGIRHMKRFIPFLSHPSLCSRTTGWGSRSLFPTAKYGNGELRYVGWHAGADRSGHADGNGRAVRQACHRQRAGPHRSAQAVPHDSEQEKSYRCHSLRREQTEAALPGAHCDRNGSRGEGRRPRLLAAACSPTPSPTSRAGWAARPSSSRRSGARPSSRFSAATSTGCRPRGSASTR